MAFLRFTLRQLETFVCVAELRSFAGAAERLGMTPQAVSQLIAELEKVLSFRLFDRSTRKVSLSAAGSDFLPRCKPPCATRAPVKVPLPMCATGLRAWSGSGRPWCWPVARYLLR